MRKMGMRSMNSRLNFRLDDSEASALKCERKSVGQRRLRSYTAEVHAEMNNRLRDLRSYATDYAIGAHQANGGNRFHEMLGDKCIDRWNARNVDDCYFGTGFYDLL